MKIPCDRDKQNTSHLLALLGLGLLLVWNMGIVITLDWAPLHKLFCSCDIVDMFVINTGLMVLAMA